MEQDRKCPKCGKNYTGHPAVSRIDPGMEICPVCGVKEALEAAGIPITEGVKILEAAKK